MSAAIDIEPSTDYDFEDADRPCRPVAGAALSWCALARFAGAASAAVLTAFVAGRIVGARSARRLSV